MKQRLGLKTYTSFPSCWNYNSCEKRSHRTVVKLGWVCGMQNAPLTDHVFPLSIIIFLYLTVNYTATHPLGYICGLCNRRGYVSCKVVFQSFSSLQARAHVRSIFKRQFTIECKLVTKSLITCLLTIYLNSRSEHKLKIIILRKVQSLIITST